MTRNVILVALVATSVGCILSVNSAEAQTRVFVSGSGSDANTCALAKPCRTFQHAHDVVLANGEIYALDPAGYGPVTITKAISIQGQGYAGITGSTANGVTINAGPSDQINLRGLLIDGGGTGNKAGIQFNTGASLNVQDSIIRNFCCGTNASGVLFLAQASSSLFVSNTVISDNNDSGIWAVPSGTGSVTIDLNHVLLQNNINVGILIGANGGPISATLSDSTAQHNGGGINVGAAPNVQASLMVANSTLSNSGNYAIVANGATAFVRVTRSRITGNVNGLLNGGGNLISYGDNNLDGNTNDGLFTNTIPTK
jgi:hypothetical protein